KVLLVLPHGKDQALRRHFEERRVVAAGIDLRVYHERCDLVQQVGVAAKARALADRSVLQLPVDFRAPRGEAGEDAAVALEPRRVLLGIFELDRTLAQEAMTLGAPPGGKAE